MGGSATDYSVAPSFADGRSPFGFAWCKDGSRFVSFDLTGERCIVFQGAPQVNRRTIKCFSQKEKRENLSTQCRFLYAFAIFLLVPTRPRIARPAQNPFDSLVLTAREAEVLTWIAQGKTNYEIGVILSACTGTVCKHVQRILSKLCVENRTVAAAIALAALANAKK